MWNPAKCKPLPGDVKNLVRSGTVLTNYAQVVEELVYNSIDADSTHIYVTIDLECFTLKVEDDGSGMSKDSFKVVGQRNATSKCSSVEDLQRIRSYGFRGETLSSLIDMSSNVQITTTVQNCHERMLLSKFFQNGIPVGESETDMAIASSIYEKGTMVKVLDVLCRFPVRQNRVDPVILMEQIINSLKHICLANSNVFLVVEDYVTEKTILSVPAYNGVMNAFNNLFLAKTPTEIHYDTLLAEHYDYGSFFLSSCISAGSHANKKLQIVFVNRRFMARNKIHRQLNKLISDALGIEKSGRGSDKEAVIKKKPKNIGSSKSDKYPVFVVNITCPLTFYDVAYEAGATNITFQDWDGVLKGCEGLVLKFAVGVQSKNALVDAKAISSLQRGQSNTEVELLQGEIGKSICTRVYPRAVHSRVAIREAFSTDGIPATSCSMDHNDLAMPMFEDISEADSLPKPSPQKLLANSLPKSPRRTQFLLAGRKSEKIHIPTLKRRSKCFQRSKPAKKKCVQANRQPDLIAKHLKELPEFKGYFRTPNSPTYMPSLDQISLSSSENEEDPFDLKQEASQGPTSSQDWINHLKSVRISNSQTVINDGAVLPSCPELTPVSHGIMKVGLWQETNKKMEDEDDMLAFRISNTTIKKVVENTRGSQNYAGQIKKDCKAVLCSTVGGIETWQKLQKLQNYSPYSQQEQNCQLASTSQDLAAETIVSDSVSSCSSSFKIFHPIPTNSPNWDTRNFDAPPNGTSEDLINSNREPRDFLNFKAEKSDEPTNLDGKISALEAEKLNPAVKHNWLGKHFPYAAKQFWKPEPSKAATNLTTQTATCSEPSGAKLGQLILQCIKGDPDELTSAKWRDGSQVNALPGRKITAPSSFNFDKKDLKDLQFMYQIDSKFLATKMSKVVNGHATKLLVLFDQHAVHERVLLEQLTASLFETDRTERRIVNTAIRPFVLIFSDTEVRILRRNRSQLMGLGIDLQAKNPTQVIISKAPVVLLNRATTEATKKQNMLLVLAGLVHYLLKEQLEYFMKTNGTFQTIPTMIFDILCSVACHAAIKFGDPLEATVCEKLLCDLGKCNTPFQCAHGRPVLYPLMDLEEAQSIADTANKLTMETPRGLADNQRRTEQQNSLMPVDEQIGETSQYFRDNQTSPYFPHH